MAARAKSFRVRPRARPGRTDFLGVISGFGAAGQAEDASRTREKYVAAQQMPLLGANVKDLWPSPAVGEGLGQGAAAGRGAVWKALLAPPLDSRHDQADNTSCAGRR